MIPDDEPPEKKNEPISALLRNKRSSTQAAQPKAIKSRLELVKGIPKNFSIEGLVELEDELQELIKNSEKFRSPGALLGEADDPRPEPNEGRASSMRRKFTRTNTLRKMQQDEL